MVHQRHCMQGRVRRLRTCPGANAPQPQCLSSSTARSVPPDLQVGLWVCRFAMREPLRALEGLGFATPPAVLVLTHASSPPDCCCPHCCQLLCRRYRASSPASLTSYVERFAEKNCARFNADKSVGGHTPGCHCKT